MQDINRIGSVWQRERESAEYFYQRAIVHWDLAQEDGDLPQAFFEGFRLSFLCVCLQSPPPSSRCCCLRSEHHSPVKLQVRDRKVESRVAAGLLSCFLSVAGFRMMLQYRPFFWARVATSGRQSADSALSFRVPVQVTGRSTNSKAQLQMVVGRTQHKEQNSD